VFLTRLDKATLRPTFSTLFEAREMMPVGAFVVRIWHSFGLQPHRSETFKLSTDLLLVEKIRDITRGKHSVLS